MQCKIQKGKIAKCYLRMHGTYLALLCGNLDKEPRVSRDTKGVAQTRQWARSDNTLAVMANKRM